MKEFNIPKIVLEGHYETCRQSSTIHSRGHGAGFSDRVEVEIIIHLADLGLVPTFSDIQKIVTNYVNTNEHEHGLRDAFNVNSIQNGFCK